MKALYLYFYSWWTALAGLPSLWTSPMIVVCAWCKRVLHVNKSATQISHGICRKCFYKQAGGVPFRLPDIKSLSIVQAFLPPKPVYDQTWVGLTLEKALLQNGRIIKRSRLNGGFTKDDYAILSNVRREASEHGMSRRYINMTEMEGEQL